MTALRTAAGRDFVALFPNLSHWAAAIEAEAAKDCREELALLGDSLDAARAEADRSLLLDAALDKYGDHLFTCVVALDGPCDCGWDAARAALAATDIRGALAEAVHRTQHPAIEDCRVGLNSRSWDADGNEYEPDWKGKRKCEMDADAILAALAAKGVES